MNAQQLANLKELRALGARILAEPERYPLDLTDFECGTFACWSGWYGRENGCDVAEAYINSSRLFGIGERASRNLFNGMPHHDNSYTELERRLSILDQIIAQHEPKGIPEHVREWFEPAESTNVEPTT